MTQQQQQTQQQQTQQQTTTTKRPLPGGLAPLTADEERQLEDLLAAADAGDGRGWFDPATGAVHGARPVEDQAGELASVTEIRRHGHEG